MKKIHDDYVYRFRGFWSDGGMCRTFKRSNIPL